MKKIILLFSIILIFTINIKISANSYEDITKPLMLIKGYDYHEILNYDNYTIIKSNVNFNALGEYEIEYVNNQTLETYIKKIYVVDENNYNTYIHSNITNINIQYETIKKISNDSYIYNIKDENSNTIYKMKNNQIIWENKLITNTYSTVVDYYEENNQIYILTNNYTIDSNYQINLYVLNQYGELLLHQSYGGSNNDTASGFEIENDYIYIYGTTLSDDGIFVHTTQNEDSFVIKIDKKDLTINRKYILPEKYIDKIISLKVQQDNIYILKQYVRLDLYRVGYKILKINPLGEVLDTYIFYNDIDFSTVKFDLLNSNLYILTNNNHSTQLYCLDTFDFKMEKIDEITSFKGVDIYTSNNTIAILCKKDNTSKILIYNLVSKKIIDKEYDFDLTNFITDKEIKTANNSLLNINYLTINKEQEKFKVKLNNQEITYNNKSNIITNDLIFGTYLNFYYYQTTLIDFCGYLNQIVNSDISVENNQTYDTFINITFNGTAYLNDVLIENNYIITDPGEYKLKVIGNDEEKNIVFKVLKLSTNEEVKENDILINKNTNINKDKNEVEANIYKEEINIKEQKKYWYFIIPLISFCMLVIVSTTKKRG